MEYMTIGRIVQVLFNQHTAGGSSALTNKVTYFTAVFIKLLRV
jgi:hypothetical protein